MRIGLHSYSCRHAFKKPGYSVFNFLDDAVNWGFESVEIVTGGAGSPPSDIGGDDPAHLKKVCAYARERNIEVHCFATYNDFAFIKNENWRQDNIAYIQHWIRLAAACGVPNLRFLSGYYSDGRTNEELEKLVIDATKICCELAEREGVNLAFENHSSIFPYANDIARLMSLVNSPRLTTCPDPTNGFSIGRGKTDDLERMYANLALLAPKASDAHLKIFGVEDGSLVGYDIDRIIAIFAEAGYDGPLHLELVDAEADPEILIRARQVIKASIERIEQGSAAGEIR